jgi:hypothetical protein
MVKTRHRLFSLPEMNPVFAIIQRSRHSCLSFILANSEGAGRCKNRMAFQGELMIGYPFSMPHVPCATVALGEALCCIPEKNGLVSPGA